MKYSTIFFLAILLVADSVRASVSDSIFPHPPKHPEISAEYIFYLHGGIIQAKGIDAVSPYFGKYEYTKIIREFADAGYIVISERRPKDSKTSNYAKKVAEWVGSLLEAGVSPENITIVGASMGAGIAVDASIRIGNQKIKYCLLGICKRSSWDYYLKHYSKDEIRLRGIFLSIYEVSDEYGSCDQFIGSQSTITSYNEIFLNMGKSHGFLYKPYDQWFLPLLDWIKQQKPSEPSNTDTSR